MSVEVQKDVKFFLINEGDLIVVERFNREPFYYIGDARGVAKKLHNIGNEYWWEFEGMKPVHLIEEGIDYRFFRVEPEPPKNWVRVSKASEWGSSTETPPVSGARRIVDHTYPDGRERFHWEFVVETMDDLKKISEANGWETLVVGFHANGVTDVTIYDDYLE